jgi:hypothetical protein
MGDHATGARLAVAEGAGEKGGAMRARYSAGLAWSLWTLTVVFSVLSLLIREQGGLIILLPLVMWTITSSAVGTIIVSRRPENPIGWILCAIGLLWASNSFFGLYAIRTLVTYPGSLPAGEVAAWFATWEVYPAFGLLAYLFFLFPNGRPLSYRWRPLLWINGLVIVVSTIVWALTPGPIGGLEGVRNPLGIEELGGGLEFTGELLFYVGDMIVLVSVLSVFFRLRHASGTTRQQIKWLAYAAALLGIVVMVSLVGDLLFGGFGWWIFLAVIVAFLGLPLSIGVAVLRYRLYDIDVIINRTLVYGSLTAMLVLIYFGSVVGLQYLLRSLTGQESQLAIVVSTLLIAALFNPLRQRVQNFIDHRFYRRKYDAAKTLEAFSAKLRDETDIDILNAELLSTVRETMQPEHVSLWLSNPERKVER